MSTLDKAESSRRNGAKSHGPVSPESRERSSRNVLKTGLYSKGIPVLSTEQQHELDALRASYYQEWLPQDRRQSDMLDKRPLQPHEQAHDAVRKWMAANRRESAGNSWEIYGDPTLIRPTLTLRSHTSSNNVGTLRISGLHPGSCPAS